MEYSDIIGSITTLFIGVTFGGLICFYSMKDKLQQYRQVNSSRRTGMLEQVAQHVGKVSHVFSKYASLVSEIGPRADRMSAKQQRELDKLSEELVTVYEEISIAESKLLLLGEKRLDKAMKLYTIKMAQFRKKIFPGRYQNIDELTQLKREVTEMRDQFYDILSERYDQKTVNKKQVSNTATTQHIRDLKIPFINSAKV